MTDLTLSREYLDLVAVGATHDEAIEQVLISNSEEALKMATNNTPAKTTKTPRVVKSLVVRIDEQLCRAVLAKKITSEELTQLRGRIERLQAFLA